MTDLYEAKDPHALFTQWFEEACAHKNIKEPTAMCLATSADTTPSARMVLLKEHDGEHFVFYTNLQSRKSSELRDNAQAALCFYWPELDKQIRVVGNVSAISQEAADAYFASRSRGKQIGAWASMQSRPMTSRNDLEMRIAEFEEKFKDQTVLRPPHWSGWSVLPTEIEFWHQREFRLHERVRFSKHNGAWTSDILYP